MTHDSEFIKHCCDDVIVRALLAAAKTLNDGRLPGERMLTRLLRGTYYEDILP